MNKLVQQFKNQILSNLDIQKQMYKLANEAKQLLENEDKESLIKAKELLNQINNLEEFVINEKNFLEESKLLKLFQQNDVLEQLTEIGTFNVSDMLVDDEGDRIFFDSYLENGYKSIKINIVNNVDKRIIPAVVVTKQDYNLAEESNVNVLDFELLVGDGTIVSLFDFDLINLSCDSLFKACPRVLDFVINGLNQVANCCAIGLEEDEQQEDVTIC